MLIKPWGKNKNYRPSTSNTWNSKILPKIVETMEHYGSIFTVGGLLYSTS
jgi:hypothetical protein